MTRRNNSIFSFPFFYDVDKVVNLFSDIRLGSEGIEDFEEIQIQQHIREIRSQIKIIKAKHESYLRREEKMFNKITEQFDYDIISLIKIVYDEVPKELNQR